MADKAIRAILQYDVDQAKLQTTLAAAKKVTGGIDDISAALQKAYASGLNFDEAMKQINANYALTGVADDANAASGNINTAATNAKVLTTDLDAAQASASGLTQRLKEAAAARASAGPDPVDSLRADAFGGGAVGAAPDLGRIGSELRKLPSIQIPGTGVGTDAIANMIRLGGAAQGLGVELGTLVPVVGLVIAAIGGLVIAIQHFAGDSKKATEDYLASQPNFVKALTESTRAQVEADLKDAENRKKAAQLTIDLSQSILDNAEAEIKRQAPTSSGAVIGIAKLFDLGGVNEIQASIDEAQKALGSASLDIDHYIAVLGNNSTAAADAAKHEQDLLDARHAMVNTVRQLVIDEGNYATASASALQSTVDRLKLDQQGNSAALSGLGADDPARKLYQDAIEEDQKRIDAITGSYLPLAQARENEIAQIDILTRSSAASSEYLTKYVADTQKANDDIAKIDLDHADKLAQIEQDSADKRQAIVQALADKQAQIVADEADKEAGYAADRDAKLQEAQQKSTDALVKLSQDTAEKRAAIEKQFASSRDSAIANRDAAAFGAAEKKRDDDLDDLNKANAKQKATIKKALEDQQATIEKAYNKQIATARAAEQKALNQAAAAAQAQLNTQAAAANKAISIENQKYSAEITLRQAALDVMVQQYQAFIAQISGAGNAYKPPGAITPDYVYTDNYPKWAHDNGVPGFASGGIARGLSHINENGMESGRNLRTGRYMVFNDPTQIYTAQQTSRMLSNGGGAHYTLNIGLQGLQTRTVEATSKAHAQRVVHDFIEAV